MWTKLRRKDALARERVQPLKPSTCLRCGYVNPREARFCLKCGYPLTVEAVREVERLREPIDRFLSLLMEDSRIREISKLREKMG